MHYFNIATPRCWLIFMCTWRQNSTTEMSNCASGWLKYPAFMLCVSAAQHLEIVPPKMKMLSSFTHPYVFPNLYFFCETNKKSEITDCSVCISHSICFLSFWSLTPPVPIDFHFLEKGSLDILPNNSNAQSQSYGFEATSEQVNNVKIEILGLNF